MEQDKTKFRFSNFFICVYLIQCWKELSDWDEFTCMSPIQNLGIISQKCINLKHILCVQEQIESIISFFQLVPLTKIGFPSVSSDFICPFIKLSRPASYVQIVVHVDSWSFCKTSNTLLYVQKFDDTHIHAESYFGTPIFTMNITG